MSNLLDLINPNQLKQLLFALKQPKNSVQGVPDSGPFMSDRLHNIGNAFNGLAPPLRREDPFAGFPPERRSGDRTSPYQPSIYEEI